MEGAVALSRLHENIEVTDLYGFLFGLVCCNEQWREAGVIEQCGTGTSHIYQNIHVAAAPAP